MKIAFWSPFHGTGATANMLALSIAISEMFSKKVLVTQTHFNMNNLEKPLLGDIEDKEGFFRDTGLDAMLRSFLGGNMTESQINNCCIRVNKSLFLLAGTKASDRTLYDNKRTHDIVAKIPSLIEPYYDYVFADTNSGSNEQTQKVIQNCDVVVITVRQTDDTLGEIVKEPFLKDKKVYYLFGSYDPMSKYSLKNLRKIHKELNKENSGGIPHCTQYMDAIADNKILKYMTSNLEADEDHADFEFFEAVREVARQIAELAENGR